MTSKYSIRATCRLCSSPTLDKVINFGTVPLANSYPSSKDENEELFSLSLVRCTTCGHVQLLETVEPKVLFSSYNYASSDSPSLIKHFDEYASTVSKRLGLAEDDFIFEIGCNDGVLLRAFKELGFRNLFGVEPAENIADIAIKKNLGSFISKAFFDEKEALAFKNVFGKMKLICANNVFAHVSELHSITNGIVKLLDDDGVFVFENAYLLDTIKGLYFDQVYHEHLQYYAIRPLRDYLRKFGLEIFDIQHVNTQGGSFRIFAKLSNSTEWEVQPSVSEWIKKEEDAGLYGECIYEQFVESVNALSYNLHKFIIDKVAEGKTVSCYGCPAKFALFSKVINLNPETIQYVVDDSPLKYGKFSPGKKIPIVNGEYFKCHPTDYCLISVWNMSDAIIARNPQYKGDWIIPLPHINTVTGH